MEAVEIKIRQFFKAYEKRFNDALNGKPIDIDGTTHAFASCFVEASPVGIMCGKNDEQFKARIPKGYEFYKSIGTKSMAVDKNEVSQLDAHHFLAKIHWKAHYEKGNREIIIEFDVLYLLQILEEIKIFAYITGDEQKVLKDYGLIPND